MFTGPSELHMPLFIITLRVAWAQCAFRGAVEAARGDEGVYVACGRVYGGGGGCLEGGLSQERQRIV